LHRAFPLVPLLLAIPLLWLGVPRLVASILKAPAHRTVSMVQNGRTPASEQLERAAVHLERVTSWEESTGLFADLGFLRLLQAVQTDPDDPQRPVLAGQAAEALHQALLLSPARPHPWVRLAYARAIGGAEPSEVAGLLAGSVSVGPFVGEIAITRLELLLRAWDHLSPEMRRYTAEQIRYIWTNDASSDLIQVAKRTPRPQVIRFALRPIRGAVERLDAAVPPPSN
jgi:hypothetical protein